MITGIFFPLQIVVMAEGDILRILAKDGPHTIFRMVSENLSACWNQLKSLWENISVPTLMEYLEVVVVIQVQGPSH